MQKEPFSPTKLSPLTPDLESLIFVSFYMLQGSPQKNHLQLEQILN